MNTITKQLNTTQTWLNTFRDQNFRKSWNTAKANIGRGRRYPNIGNGVNSIENDTAQLSTIETQSIQTSLIPKCAIRGLSSKNHPPPLYLDMGVSRIRNNSRISAIEQN